AFSRFGTMFFTLPGSAMRNIRRALKPGGELTMIVWRRREENPWLYDAELCVSGFDRIGFERFDADICIGRDLDEAVDFAMALGPAGEIMRLAGEEGEKRKPLVVASLREALSSYSRG